MVLVQDRFSASQKTDPAHLGGSRDGRELMKNISPGGYFRSLLSALLLVLVLGTGLVPVSAASNTSTVGDNSFPEKFDLRDYGVVTPVKTQNPWLSCWAFGGIAAAESSLLTSMGLTCEEYKELSGEEFDLSEKHLAWFSKYKISELTNSSQAGEGLWSFGQDDDPLLA